MAVVITPKRGDSDPGTDVLADGEIAISVGNDKQFKKFSNLIGKPEWA